MKVLVLGSRIPYPMHDGGAKASYQLLQILNDLNHEVTFFSFNTKKHLILCQDYIQAYLKQKTRLLSF